MDDSTRTCICREDIPQNIKWQEIAKIPLFIWMESSTFVRSVAHANEIHENVWEYKKKNKKMHCECQSHQHQAGCHCILCFFDFPLTHSMVQCNLKYIFVYWFALAKAKHDARSQSHIIFCLLKFNELLRKLQNLRICHFCVSQPKRKENKELRFIWKIITNYQCRKCSIVICITMRIQFQRRTLNWTNNIFVDKLTTYCFMVMIHVHGRRIYYTFIHDWNA